MTICIEKIWIIVHSDIFVCNCSTALVAVASGGNCPT